jgi:hypothetical protein
VRRTTHNFPHCSNNAATLMWRWGSGCQLEAPNDLACLRLQILGKDHGHEYLSDTTGREGRSGSRKRAALQQRACMSQAQKADIDQGRECSKDGGG